MPFEALRGRLRRYHRMIVVRRPSIVLMSVNDRIEAGGVVVLEEVVVVRNVEGDDHADESALDQRGDRHDGGGPHNDMVKHRSHDPADSASGPRNRQIGS